MRQKTYIISVLGTQNPIGQALLAELERQNYPADRILPLDLHQEAGKSFYYKGQTLTSAALDLFDLTQPHILFLCDARIFDRYPHHLSCGKNWLIDCTGKIQKAKCIIPNLNVCQSQTLRTKCLCAPQSAAIAMAQALVPLDKHYSLITADVMGIMGAWYYNSHTPEVLIKQTRNFFTQNADVSDLPLFAFNLIPDFFEATTPLILHQMKCFLQAPIRFKACFAPSIRGGIFFVRALFRKRPCLKKISDIYDRIGMCCLVANKDRLSTQDLLAEEQIFVQNMSLHKNELCFWILQDYLQTGAIQNAVRILTLLTK